MKKTTRACLAIMTIFTSVLLVQPVTTYARGLGVQEHTKEEVLQYINSHSVSTSSPITYEVNPVTTAPYSPGKLSQSTLQAALDMTNQIRYVAGLSEVTLNEYYNERAQTGCLVNYANNSMSHTPLQPSDMAEDLYKIGYDGTSHSNLGWGYSSLTQAILYGWMVDADSSNVEGIGHRRWVLFPKLQQVGFGCVGTHNAMYVVGNKSQDTTTNIAWPAQVTPKDWFPGDSPWNMSTGTDEDVSKVKVTLTRNTDGKVWYFAQGTSDGYFNVDNRGYGLSGCVIFRPSGISKYESGTYSVHIEGLKQGTVDYNVEFFGRKQVPTITVGNQKTTIPLETEDFYLNATSTGDGRVRYSVDDNSILYVTSYGEVVPVSIGSTYVTITTDESERFDSASVRIRLQVTEIEKKPQKILISPSKYTLKMGEDIYLDAETDGDGDITYSSTDKSVAKVSSYGTVTAVGPGTASIVIVASETEHYIKSSYNVSITVKEPDKKESPSSKKPGRISAQSAKKVSSSGIKVTWSCRGKADGYRIQYAENSSFQSAKTIWVNGAEAGSKNISKLKKGKTYYVRVAAYTKGSDGKVFSANSTKIKVKL